MNRTCVFRSILLLTFLVAALPLACGGRSKLRGAQPCRTLGEVRACDGVCGEGTSECVAGFWTDCFVPAREEPCENACGAGTRRCEDELWGECVVETVVETCENDCGIGERTCRDNEWNECQVEPVTTVCSFGCGDGFQTCTDNEWGACDAPQPLPPTLRATVRDFSDSHPDFERRIDLPGSTGLQLGIVADVLDDNGKPIYLGGSGDPMSTTDATSFNEWYSDEHPEGAKAEITISLTESSVDEDFYVYEDRQFFPIDGQLLGNEGRIHNYHFTLEAEATFVYREGQVFAFDGDDDIWVFINNRLVIDLGGLHASLRSSVALDDVADDIGIVPGEEYPLKIFFAERHTVDSNFVIETSIANLGECP